MPGAIKCVSTLVLSVVASLTINGCVPGGAVPPTPTKASATAPTVAPKAKGSLAAPTPARPAATLAPTIAAVAPRPVTVRWGATAALHQIATYVAIEKGYFKEEGITVDVIPIETLGEQTPVLAKGDLDLATGGFSPSLVNAVQRGIPVKIVAESGNPYPGFSHGGLTVRKDLYDEGNIRAIPDLKGRRIAVASVEGNSAFLAPLFAEAGLTLKDVDLVVLRPPDLPGAFATRSVDAGYTLEPILTQILSMGLAVFWKPVADFRPGTMGAVTAASPQFLHNREVANRWMVANLRGVRAYLEALRTGKGVDEIIDIAVKHTTVKDRSLFETMVKEKRMVGYSPNGSINPKRFAEDIKLWQDLGYITGTVDANSLVDLMVDLSLVDYAVQKLGRQ